MLTIVGKSSHTLSRWKMIHLHSLNTFTSLMRMHFAVWITAPCFSIMVSQQTNKLFDDTYWSWQESSPRGSDCWELIIFEPLWCYSIKLYIWDAYYSVGSNFPSQLSLSKTKTDYLLKVSYKPNFIMMINGSDYSTARLQLAYGGCR